MGRHSDPIRAGWSGDRISVEARFSVPVQTGPAVLYNGYRGPFPGVKRLGRGVDHPPTSNAAL